MKYTWMCYILAFTFGWLHNSSETWEKIAGAVLLAFSLGAMLIKEKLLEARIKDLEEEMEKIRDQRMF